MFNVLMKQLYYMRAEVLLQNGWKNGLIKPFDEDLYDELSKIYFGGLPVLIRIKYMRPSSPPMQCYERALLISLGLPGSILADGDRKDIELDCGKGNGGHRWVEYDGWVYDPTSLYKFKKELYYKIYEIRNLIYSKPENCAKKEWYKDVLNTKLEDYKPGGEKRLDLFFTIPHVKKIAEFSSNEEFKTDLNDYLKLIEYGNENVKGYLLGVTKDLRKFM